MSVMFTAEVYHATTIAEWRAIFENEVTRFSTGMNRSWTEMFVALVISRLDAGFHTTVPITQVARRTT